VRRAWRQHAADKQSDLQAENTRDIAAEAKTLAFAEPRRVPSMADMLFVTGLVSICNGAGARVDSRMYASNAGMSRICNGAGARVDRAGDVCDD